MKHTKKLSAIIMSAVLLATGCANGTSPGGSTAVKEESAPVTSENTGSSGESSLPQAKSVKDTVGDVKVDTKVKFMAWYDLNNTDAANYFVSLFGMPEKIPEGYENKVKSSKKNSDGSEEPDTSPFVYVHVSTYASRYTELAKLIQSGDSPDAFPCDTSDFPYWVVNKYFDKIDNAIDLDNEEFAKYEKVREKTKIGDHEYVPVYDTELSNLLWYRASVIKKNGFEDPWELYEKDEWTWDKFLEMSKSFADKENAKYAIDGYGTDFYLFATTGLPLVELKDGTLRSNLTDEKIIKAMDFVRQFAPTQKGYRYPRETENSWVPCYSEWANGNTLFFNDGSWRYDETWRVYKKKNKWSDDEINFVPYPRCDDEQTYYQSVQINSFMLPKGSKNTEGYKALIYSQALLVNDEDINKASRQEAKEEYDWNDKLLDRLDKLNAPDTFAPVVDYKVVLYPHDDLFCGDSYINVVCNWSYMSGEDYRANIESEDGKEYIDSLEKIGIEPLNKIINEDLAN